MDVDLGIYTVIAVLTVIGSFIQSSIGLGLGLFAAPLALLIAPTYVPGPLLVPMLATSMLTAWRELPHVDWSGAGMALAGRLPAALLAGLTISLLSQQGYAIVFAVLILVAVAISVVGWKVHPSGRAMVAAGFASGYMGTLTSIGGPPMVIVMQYMSGPTVRATLSAYFTVGAAFSLAALAIFGALTWMDLIRGALLIPPTYLGFWLSRYGLASIDAGLLRPLLLGLVSASAVGLLIRYGF